MLLAGMVALDEDALICDFAETYHIYDFRRLPVEYAATLADGLRENSRIKMLQSGLVVDFKTLLLAHIVDNTATNVYFKTKDAQKGKNKPKSVVELLTKPQKEHARRFATGEDFDKEWRRLNGYGIRTSLCTNNTIS